MNLVLLLVTLMAVGLTEAWPIHSDSNLMGTLWMADEDDVDDDRLFNEKHFKKLEDHFDFIPEFFENEDYNYPGDLPNVFKNPDWNNPLINFYKNF